MTLLNSLIALTGFSSFYAIAFLINRRDTAHIYQFVCSWGLVSLGMALPNIVGFQTDSLFYALIAAALYWAMALNVINVSGHFKRNETFITAINLLLIIGAWFLISLNVLYVLIPMIFLTTALYQRVHKFNQSRLGEYLSPNSELFFHSVAAITYVILLAELNEYRLDLLIAPVLAVHGAFILFIKE